MPEFPVLFLAACMLLGAALYTSVGHAGASAYIALMALFGSAPVVMRPTALALNILVAGFTSFRYLTVGLFRWRTLWPFLLGAVQFAFLGGSVQLPGAVAGLLGNVAIVKALPADLWVYAIAVTLGAFLGTTLGIQWRPPMILKALGAVLIIAGLKLIGVY